MRRATGLAVVLCSVLLPTAAAAGEVQLAGYAGGGSGTYAVPVKSLMDVRFSTTVRQQQDWSCGSAAVATVLTFHYAHPITERDALEAMFARGDQQRIQREGFSLLDLKRYLDSLGYEANGYETGLDKLAEAGIPAIVVINDRGYNHFVVVKGIRNGSVLVGDPAKGLRVLSREHFDRMWNPRILFVITARRDRAAFNTAVDWRYMGAPLGPAVSQDGLARVLLSRPGMTDF